MTTEHCCFDKTCKSRFKTDGLVLITVKWHDASYQAGPSFLGNIIEDYILETGGFLVKETETHYSIALDFCREDATWRHITNVPKGMVTEVQKFPIPEIVSDIVI
jgi:hypothetical protein